MAQMHPLSPPPGKALRSIRRVEKSDSSVARQRHPGRDTLRLSTFTTWRRSPCSAALAEPRRVGAIADNATIIYSL